MGDYSVLFVCTANRIRSPMAAVFWRAYVTDHYPDDRWEIGSAGTWAQDGLPAMPLAVRILAEHELSFQRHRSRLIDRALVDHYRLIVVMERGHQEALRIEFPHAASRIFLLSELSGPAYDIVDPVGGGPDEYRRTAEELRRLLVAGADRLRTLAHNPPSRPLSR
ncbi:MAG TPA: hypothetical protein VNK95_08725 [Caldilineaceae bacterium]|nr:hypothetical protein [Caldilineaceae bacterium]